MKLTVSFFCSAKKKNSRPRVHVFGESPSVAALHMETILWKNSNIHLLGPIS